MNTEIKNTILTTDKDAQYDESAKRLLGQKSILAHILVKTVDEFAGMDPKDVVPYIEGEPFINTVPIETGFTNTVIKNSIYLSFNYFYIFISIKKVINNFLYIILRNKHRHIF